MFCKTIFQLFLAYQPVHITNLKTHILKFTGTKGKRNCYNEIVILMMHDKFIAGTTF